MRDRAPRHRHGGRWLVAAGYAGLGLGCLLLGAIAFLIVAAPVELLRDRLITEVKARTGRDLVVSGSTSLLLLPRPAISVADVTLSAPSGMEGGPTLFVQALEAELNLPSLLTGQAAIRRLVLFRPKIELKVDTQGRRSWDFARAEPSRTLAASGDERWHLLRVAAPGTPVPPSQPASGGNLASMLEKLAPLNLGLRDGSVHYADERSGANQDLTALDIDVLLDDGAGPLQANGSFNWRGETVTVAGDVASFRALLEERATRLSLKLSGQPFEARYDGKIEVGAGLGLQGNIDLKSPSLRALGAWADNKSMAAAQDAGTLTLSSALTGENGRIALADLTGTLGGSSLRGDLSIEARSARPYVTGSLNLSELDLGSILIHPASNADPGSAFSDRPTQPGAVQRGPQVRGFTKRAGGGADWSDDVIDPGPLTLADADLTLAADRLVFKDVKTGPVRLSLALADSVARLTLQEMRLYEGRGRGVATLDGRGQVPAISVNMLLEGISAQPLLKDTLGFEWLEGRSTLTVALAGQGASERQMITTLGGKIDLATTGGTIDAIDIGKVLRSIGEGRFTGLRVAQGEKTPFSELAGSFTIANGMADNQDLRLVSPNLRVSGAGSFNLPARTLDYTVRLKLASLNASIDRAVINLSNVEVPVHIDGSWDKPNFSLTGQEQVLDAVKQIGKNLKSQEVQDAIKGLLGEDGQQKVKPRDVLEKLLKKQ
ncbi:MAG: AsmA family protein [Hyphomicrobiaceae bacterium]|nr:AsmA family protein [Hyphomicrobiaceae bacterium]